MAYGRFDHLRLLNTLRVVQPPDAGQPVLALERGGVQTAESLILARHFMFTQVYQHHVRQIYDVHWQEYLAAWLSGGRFPASLARYVAIGDAVVEASFQQDARNARSARHSLARRLTGRRHFRRSVTIQPVHRKADPNVFSRVSKLIREQFGADQVRFCELRSKEASLADFRVIDEDRVRSITEFSDMFLNVKPAWEGRIYCDPSDPELRRRVRELCLAQLPTAGAPEAVTPTVG